MAVKRELKLGKKAKSGKGKCVLDKYFNRTTSQKAPEEPRHSEDDDNVESQHDDVMPYVKVELYVREGR